MDAINAIEKINGYKRERWNYAMQLFFSPFLGLNGFGITMHGYFGFQCYFIGLPLAMSFLNQSTPR